MLAFFFCMGIQASPHQRLRGNHLDRRWKSRVAFLFSIENGKFTPRKVRLISGPRARRLSRFGLIDRRDWEVTSRLNFRYTPVNLGS
jgi:hypothetical protein